MSLYKLKYSDRYDSDIKKIKRTGNKFLLKKISVLLKEIAEHPREGTGHPEQLKGRPDCWSRRITQKHRLVYQIREDVVIVLVLAAYGHYDDR